MLKLEANSWTEWPESLSIAAEYSLFGGGKRIRPILAMMVSEAFGHRPEDVRAWACAVEMVHTYSLIHDDLPSMDDDSMRRGLPTCHIKFGEAMAILAGDALLTEAFGVIGRLDIGADIDAKLIRLLATAAGGAGMVGGQVHDIQGSLSSLDKIKHMQDLKTGALISAAAQGAAITIGRSQKEIEQMAVFGASLGALFQITDDILDRQEDREADGNNLFHHLEETDVYSFRDSTVSQAIAALSILKEGGHELRELVHHIARRSV
jgi:geranylgeranyl diphosphate synthase type II